MSYSAISANFTRPADTTAYASGDLVANSVTNTSVTPMTFRFGTDTSINFVKVKKSTATATNAKFTLYLFSSLPTVANGDNGAYSPIEFGYITNIACDCSTSLGSDAASESFTLSVPIRVPGTVYGLLKATAAYTPGNAEVFTVTVAGTN